MAVTCGEKEKTATNDICIVPYKDEYCERVMHVGNEMFGEGYLTREKLNGYLKSKNIFCVAIEEDKVIGYCMAVEESIEEAERLLKVERSEIVRYNGNDNPICLFKSMAIDKQYQRRGIARRLFGYCHCKCAEAGYQSAWGSAWKIGESVAMAKIFAEFEFNAIATIPNIWYDDDEYKCAVCGGRCACTGVIFVKKF